MFIGGYSFTGGLMSNEQVLLLVDSLSQMSALDSFLGAFIAVGAWRLIDWFFKSS